MNTYLLVHRAPHDYTGSPEAAAWEAWFGWSCGKSRRSLCCPRS